MMLQGAGQSLKLLLTLQTLLVAQVCATDPAAWISSQQNYDTKDSYCFKIWSFGMVHHSASIN